MLLVCLSIYLEKQTNFIKFGGIDLKAESIKKRAVSREARLERGFNTISTKKKLSRPQDLIHWRI